MSSREGWPPQPEPLPAPVVDNHCHLDHPGREGTRLAVDDALGRAAASNVTRIVQVGCDVDSSRWAVQTAEEYPEIVAAVALHPNDAARMERAAELPAAIAVIDELAGSRAVRAIGETGLDYYRTGADGRPAQHESFRAHIQLAKKHEKTLVIHDRDAHEDVLAVLDDEGMPERTIMHCFSGDADFARECVSRGAWLSFAGTVTFKNASGLRAALAATPADRILVETDAPFLTPEPHRGKPNASFLIPHTLRRMAEVKGMGVSELCDAVTANTNAAYGGAW